jgi:hypothetical protein
VRRAFHRIVLFCLTVTPAVPSGSAEPVPFSPWTTNLASLTGATFVAADFNNDGRMDVLLHGITNNIITAPRSLVLTNRGDGNFGLFSYEPGSLASFSAGDWNNDGKLDLLRLAGGSSAISIQTNNSFQDHLTLPTRPADGRRGLISMPTAIWMDSLRAELSARVTWTFGSKNQRAVSEPVR